MCMLTALIIVFKDQSAFPLTLIYLTEDYDAWEASLRVVWNGRMEKKDSCVNISSLLESSLLKVAVTYGTLAIRFSRHIFVGFLD